MTKATAKKIAKKLDRQAIRDQLLGHAPKPKKIRLTLFGVEIELRQPTLGAILDAAEVQDENARNVDMIINYAYVPDTNELIFEPSDREMILNWPFGEDMVHFQEVASELTGIEIKDAEEKLQTNPLKSQS